MLTLYSHNVPVSTLVRRPHFSELNNMGYRHCWCLDVVHCSIEKGMLLNITQYSQNSYCIFIQDEFICDNNTDNRLRSCDIETLSKNNKSLPPCNLIIIYVLIIEYTG